MYILIFLLVVSCQSDKQSSVVARVGTENISINDLRQFESSIDDSSNFSLEQHLEYLRTLIDRELLLSEEANLSLQNNYQLKSLLAKDSEERLAKIVHNRHIDDKAIPNDDEIEIAKASGGWNEHVVSVEIFLNDLDRAEEVRQEILDGMDIYEAGRQYSMDRTMHLPMGGAQQFVYNRYDGPEEIVRRVFQIPVGGLSSPIKFRQGYILAYCAERRLIDPSEIEDAIIRHLKKNKKEMIRGAFLQYLNNSLDLQFDNVGLTRAIELLSVENKGRREFEKSDSSQVALSYGNQLMSVADLIERVVNVSFDGDILTHSDLIASLKNRYLPQMLLAEYGRKQGIKKDAEYREWIESRREDLMISLLRQEICKDISVSEEEIENRYRQTKSRFAIPSYARVRDVLVEDEKLAKSLKARVESGEQFEEIIEINTLRSGRKKTGMYRVFALQTEQYGTAWINYVMNIPLNEIHGPIKAKGGYSLIEVIERVKDQFYTLNENRVRDAVIRDVKTRKQRVVFNEFVKNLRSKRAGEIEIFDDSIRIGFGI